MSEEYKPDQTGKEEVPAADEQQQKSRRDFLISLGRWSSIIIGGVAMGGMMTQQDFDAAGWVNGGGGWVNARGGGGGGAAWVNRAGGGGAAWVNRGGGWINGGGGGWINRRSSWVNRY